MKTIILFILTFASPRQVKRTTDGLFEVKQYGKSVITDDSTINLKKVL